MVIVIHYKLYIHVTYASSYNMYIHHISYIMVNSVCTDLRLYMTMIMMINIIIIIMITAPPAAPPIGSPSSESDDGVPVIERGEGEMEGRRGERGNEGEEMIG